MRLHPDANATPQQAEGEVTKGIASLPAFRVAIWFEDEQEFDPLPFIFFVVSANAAQQSFQFCFPDPPDGLTFAKARKALLAGQQIFQERYDVYVFLTAARMKGNLFFIEHGPLVHITTHGWQENFSPPSVFEYLFHSTMCGTIYALCKELTHHEDCTVGCQFEYTRIKEQDRVDIALGYICAEHEHQIRRWLGDKVFTDLQVLVKFSWLGSPEEQGTVAYKIQDLFSYDLRKDSGYKKTFVERVQQNIDAIWFDMAKEVFKGLILIVVAFLLFKFGLKP
jgi:hypothetical protein